MPIVRHPMLATLVDAPFDDDAWLFETKWDGVRALCRIEGRSVALTSRNGKDQLPHYPELAALAKEIRGPALVDGEIVSWDESGRSSFQRLQSRLNLVPDASTRDLVPVCYVVFDAIYADGRDLRDAPLDERKRVLRGIVAPRGRLVRCSRHLIGAGRKAFAAAARARLEGIVAKRLASTYQERRSRDWLKIKCVQEQEVVIGGWTEPRGSRRHFGSLLVGVYDRGALVFAGGVGTGFDRALLDSVMKKLRPLAADKSPFAGRGPKTAHWVKPRLVCEVKFSEWTSDGIMRQPVFLGLRDDKAAKDVVRERPSRRR